MGSRRVLGNDPFQRGAAERPSQPEVPATASTGAAKDPEPGTRSVAKPSGPAGRATGATKKRRPRAPPTVPPPGSPVGPRTGRPARETSAAANRRAQHAAAPAAEAPRASVTRPPGSEPPLAQPGPGQLASAPPRVATLPAPDVWTRPLAPSLDATEPPAGASASLMDALREAPGLLAEAWSALEAAARALRAGLGTAGGEQIDLYGRDARLSEAVAPLVDFLYTRWFRVEVEGAANIPTGGALLVANHAGALPLDGPMLHEALRRERPELPESRWLAEDQVFYAPLLGTLFNRLGAVRASPDSATRLLAEGRPVCIFPEGIQGIGKPFRDRYRLQRFGRGGFVKLALRTGRPILPVAIMGAEETLPLLGKLPGGLLGVPYVPLTPLGPLPLPAKWRIRIGEPLAVPPGARETDLSVVESLVEATRNSIEHMLRALLGARGGVFLG